MAGQAVRKQIYTVYIHQSINHVTLGPSYTRPADGMKILPSNG